MTDPNQPITVTPQLLVPYLAREIEFISQRTAALQSSATKDQQEQLAIHLTYLAVLAQQGIGVLLASEYAKNQKPQITEIPLAEIQKNDSGCSQTLEMAVSAGFNGNTMKAPAGRLAPGEGQTEGDLRYRPIQPEALQQNLLSALGILLGIPPGPTENRYVCPGEIIKPYFHTTLQGLATDLFVWVDNKREYGPEQQQAVANLNQGGLIALALKARIEMLGIPQKGRDDAIHNLGLEKVTADTVRGIYDTSIVYANLHCTRAGGFAFVADELYGKLFNIGQSGERDLVPAWIPVVVDEKRRYGLVAECNVDCGVNGDETMEEADYLAAARTALSAPTRQHTGILRWRKTTVTRPPNNLPVPAIHRDKLPVIEHAYRPAAGDKDIQASGVSGDSIGYVPREVLPADNAFI